jgi:tetratricopeptide (TPR) repeat protein
MSRPDLKNPWLPLALCALGSASLFCCPSRRPSQPSRKEASGLANATNAQAGKTNASADAKAGAGSPARPGHRDPEPTTPKDRALWLMRQGKLTRAETVVTKALTSDPNAVVMHIILARIRISQNRHADAVKTAEKAISLAPRNAESHGLKARALMLAGKHGKALGSVSKAVEYEPNQARWHRMLGKCHLARGKPRDALKALKRAQELDRSSAWTHVLKGDAYWARHRYNEAQTAYREAAGLPNDGRAWQAEALDRLASLLKDRRKRRKARQVLAECKRRFPDLGCPYAEAALSPPDPTQPGKRETFVKPPGPKY